MVRIDPTHLCRDAWGTPHRSDDLERLTLDHVKDQPRFGRRAPSDPWHLVAMCASANIGGPSREVRYAERAYLAALGREAS